MMVLVSLIFLKSKDHHFGFLWFSLKGGKKKSDLANRSLVRVFFWKHQRTGSFHERTGKESAVRTVGLLKISKHLRSQG
jgi:hypothetical protein